MRASKPRPCLDAGARIRHNCLQVAPPVPQYMPCCASPTAGNHFRLQLHISDPAAAAKRQTTAAAAHQPELGPQVEHPGKHQKG
eukprot:1159766-Pelagomonas_calceolata.AAC.4